MNNGITYEEIKEQIKILNELYNKAVSDDSWEVWNSHMNSVGKMMEQYGRARFNRGKQINIILDLE